MPKKFSQADKSHWLQLLESGKTERWIATKKAHCDVRTVKKGIEEARRQQEAQVARADLLKVALRNHQDSLLSVVDSVLSALALPVPNLEMRWDQSSTPLAVPLPGAMAHWGEDEACIVVLTAEGKPEWELLQEHLRRDQIWNALAQWKKAFAAHLEARLSLKRKTAALLEEKTGYKLVEEPIDPPFLYSHTTIDLFYQVALNRTLKVQDRTNPEDNIAADTATGEVRHGIGSILAKAPGAEEECKANILDAFKELQLSDEASRAAQTYRSVEEFTVKAKRAVEEISLLGLVPGRCRVCRRLGI